MAENVPLQRFVIVGPSGSGKTTLGRQIAARQELPFVELDALHWGANWTMPTEEDFRERVARALEGEAWVADGNYGKARDITWGRAQALVWLDYPLSVCLARLLIRTVRRVVTREVLWNGNYETLRGQIAPDGLIPYTIRRHRGRRERYVSLLQEPAYAHLAVFRLRSPSEARRWLKGIRAGSTLEPHTTHTRKETFNGEQTSRPAAHLGRALGRDQCPTARPREQSVTGRVGGSGPIWHTGGDQPQGGGGAQAG